MNDNSNSMAEISGTMSHYLGELYRLGGNCGFVSPSALADVVEVTPPAVARMVRRLEAIDLVERKPYKGVRLTASGERQALRSIRYHRLAEAFLVNSMGYGWHEAHALADALAEIADETFVDRMDDKAGHPKRCPHGEPIPTADGMMPEIHDLPLAELDTGSRGVVSRVQVRETDKLIYLAESGLVPGAGLEVEGRAPFDGPIRLNLEKGSLVIGSELARRIRIETKPSRLPKTGA